MPVDMKAKIAQTLYELLKHKSLDKITVKELVDTCNISRQSFYYHFQDIYDLVRWMFQQEAVSLLRQHDGALLWQEGLLQLLRYIEENRAVCRCALQSLGRVLHQHVLPGRHPCHHPPHRGRAASSGALFAGSGAGRAADPSSMSSPWPGWWRAGCWES